MLESKYTVNVIITSDWSPLHPCVISAVRKPCACTAGSRNCTVMPFTIFLSSPQARHYRPYPLPSQHGQKYLSVSFPHALPISFLSGHSDRLQECSSITSRNPLAFINSAHYELLSYRESKRGIGNVVFCSLQFKGTVSRDRF
jgi:hypothetical protein